MSEEKIKVLVVGAGNMGRSHALAYASIPEFEIVAVCTRSQESRAKLMSELPEGTLGMNDYENALNELKLDGSYQPIPTRPRLLKWLWRLVVMYLLKNHWRKIPSSKELVDLAIETESIGRRVYTQTTSELDQICRSRQNFG